MRRPYILRSFFYTVLLLLLVSGTAFSSEGAVAAAASPWMIVPFAVLLLSIALMPFIAKHWWERHFPIASVVLGSITVVYYVAILNNPERMLHSGIEFVGFLSLVGSLFVVSGGLHIRLRGHSTPVTNVLLLLFGALFANVVGTTGASMILIRPWLRNNKYRMHAYHVVFFIFIVSNVGGALTPIGDPPLFLGYLKGIPFFWVLENLWPMWLLAISLLLAVFYAIDLRYYRKVPAALREQMEKEGEKLSFQGLHNLGFLLMILIAVFIQHPIFLREAIMLAAAAGSYLTTKRDIHVSNHFNFHPIREVGYLFLGLFATMVPALDWLELNAASLGISSPADFFWGSGVLSALLDNAPTYLNFLSASIGLFVTPEVLATLQRLIGEGTTAQLGLYPREIQQAFAVLQRYHGAAVAQGNVGMADMQIAYLLGAHNLHIVAISLGAVFFGAMTYIGNAPNFMVKSIAEQSGARTPSFFGLLLKFAIPVLLPIFVIVWYVFLR